MSNTGVCIRRALGLYWCGAPTVDEVVAVADTWSYEKWGPRSAATVLSQEDAVAVVLAIGGLAERYEICVVQVTCWRES